MSTSWRVPIDVAGARRRTYARIHTYPHLFPLFLRMVADVT